MIYATVKDKVPYLAKWSNHHKLIGFGRLVMYDDGSANSTRCVLDTYVRRNDVTRIPEDIGACHMKDLP